MAEAGTYRVFLSAVTSEFGTAREEIARDLRARGLMVRVQSDFRQEAKTDTTLQKLDQYIGQCDALVHVAGKRSGAFAGEEEARPFLHVLPVGVTRASYTEFEFHLACHHGRHSYVYIANDDYIPDVPKPSTADDDPAQQARHVGRLKKLDRDYFSTKDRLCRLVLKCDWPNIAIRRPNTLPFASLGDLFKGRQIILDDLQQALIGRRCAAAVIGKAVRGTGGIGKTRLAIEYAWRHAPEYSALLFLPGDSPAKLESGLAALVGVQALDLPEKEATQDEVKVEAALRWLSAHPTWLAILDNVDDEKAVAAVAALLPRLAGGHVIITARASEFPASVPTFELDVLTSDAAAQFLLERTQDKRTASTNDPVRARELADELGGLALGLEQAGAYIAHQCVGFARYLLLWRKERERVLKWFDPTAMSYNHDVGLAVAWATSVDKLTPQSLLLLDRLAFLAPDPIPNSLLDVTIPGEAADFDAYEARAGLYAYSLISLARGDDGAENGFAVHRLVQDFARRAMSDERRSAALQGALGWIDAAFAADGQDVRNWPVLDPLLPHALAIARRGDDVGIAEPPARLLNGAGLLLHAKARYAEAELLHRRALAIREAGYGPKHPEVARVLNDLAALLQEAGRGAEAEPLCRRALAIDEASHGPDHPDVARDLNNLAAMLHRSGRSAEAEPLFRRALAILEANYGLNHRGVAKALSNLASVLEAIGRAGEAEPLYRRAMEIDEANFGLEHPEVARDINNLAGLLCHSGRLAEAEALFRRALAICEASFGLGHPNTALVRRNLAELIAHRP